MNSELRPAPIEHLFARWVGEWERRHAIFDLPRRSIWRSEPGLDFAVRVHGETAATPVGVAAGPHAQLAQNLAVAWLAGARVLELKTVQVRDRLEIPRPCIDAAAVGFNVEWSQELRLDQSLEQYVTGWFLIHALAAQGVNGTPGGAPGAVFEASVGYDLAGIRSDAVARFLDGVADCGPVIERLRRRLPPALRRHGDTPVPSRMCSCVTLSTFHGCPPEEIQQIVEHVFERHRLNVVVKLNPTLLGYDAVDAILHRQLGYDEIRLDPAAFARDLQWNDAQHLIERLSAAAARRELGFGVKLTNTLVVGNHRGVFADERMYLSGPPLHPIAIALAERIARATGGRVPMAFSAGADADNVAETLACGFLPVTTCTDLLKPPGFRRLPRYLKALAAEFRRVGARTIDEYVRARAAEAPAAEGAERPAARAGVGARDDHETGGPGMPAVAGESAAAPIATAAARNLTAYAARVANDPRYHSAANRDAPRRSDTRLSWFDCASCNACLVVCPNDAVFAYTTAPTSTATADLTITESGAVTASPATFAIREPEQWAVFADFCNACGNCDTFCPEVGGPFAAKPRFGGSREAFDAAAPGDAVLLDGDTRVVARLAGVTYTLDLGASGARFDDGTIEADLDATLGLRDARARVRRPGHVLSLARAHALRILRDGALASVNPVAAARDPNLVPTD